MGLKGIQRPGRLPKETRKRDVGVPKKTDAIKGGNEGPCKKPGRDKTARQSIDFLKAGIFRENTGRKNVERETSLELATSTLARLRSTN